MPRQNSPTSSDPIVKHILTKCTLPARQYLENPNNTTCPICNKHFLCPNTEIPIKLPCNHVIGTSCLLNWLLPLFRDPRNSCPYCQRKILSYNEIQRIGRAGDGGDEDEDEDNEELLVSTRGLPDDEEEMITAEAQIEEEDTTVTEDDAGNEDNDNDNTNPPPATASATATASLETLWIQTCNNFVTFLETSAPSPTNPSPNPSPPITEKPLTREFWLQTLYPLIATIITRTTLARYMEVHSELYQRWESTGLAVPEFYAGFGVALALEKAEGDEAAGQRREEYRESGEERLPVQRKEENDRARARVAELVLRMRVWRAAVGG